MTLKASESAPLQVYVARSDLRDLERWAQQRGWSKSEAVRAAIRALTRSDERDPLLAGSGMIEGLPADASRAMDRYLDATFVAEKPRRRARKPVRR